MRAAVYYSNRDVRVEEMDRPRIGPRELLVKVMACGICGTDVLEWYRIKRAPLVLGHEATGEIVEVGEGVEDLKKGGRVFVSHHVPCNTCRYCLAGHQTACETLHKTNYHPGGLSEYIRVPEINVEQGIFTLPEGVSFTDGTLIEPLACVVRGQRLAGIRADDTVVVLGSGVSGLLHVQLAHAKGVKRLIATDVSDYRLNVAKKFGADAVINAKEEDVQKRLLKINEGSPADQVVLCTGAMSACEQALECVDRGGTILFFAVPAPSVRLPIPLADFWRSEVTMITSYGAAPDDLRQALKLIDEHTVNAHDMITHRLRLDEVGLGFRLVAEAGESLKVIIEPHK